MEMALENKVWAPGVLIITGVPLRPYPFNRARKYMHLYVRIHTHTYIYTYTYIYIDLLEIMNSHQHLQFQSVPRGFFLVFLSFMFLCPSFSNENPDSQQHGHICSFIKSCNMQNDFSIVLSIALPNTKLPGRV